jgi:hypothetical protein
MHLGILLTLVSLSATTCLDNGLGMTPQMGWNSWNRYGCTVGEEVVKRAADLMIKTGLADKGYIYINIDDCWQVSGGLCRLLATKPASRLYKIEANFQMGLSIWLTMCMLKV